MRKTNFVFASGSVDPLKTEGQRRWFVAPLFQNRGITAWLKKRWLSFQIHLVLDRMDQLEHQQQILQDAQDSMEKEIESLAREARRLTSKAKEFNEAFDLLCAATSGPTIRPSALTSKLRLVVDSSARRGS
jgi:hypothetical protein